MMKAYRRHCFFKKEELTSVCFSARFFSSLKKKSMNGGTEMSSLSLSFSSLKKGDVTNGRWVPREWMETFWRFRATFWPKHDDDDGFKSWLGEITWKSRRRKKTGFLSWCNPASQHICFRENDASEMQKKSYVVYGDLSERKTRPRRSSMLVAGSSLAPVTEKMTRPHTAHNPFSSKPLRHLLNRNERINTICKF